MSTEVRIQSITMHHYSYGTASGSITIAAGKMTSTFELTEAEAEELQRVAARFYNDRKREFAASIIKANPMPALEYRAPAPATDDEIPS